jgi:hypothetical protein
MPASSVGYFSVTAAGAGRVDTVTFKQQQDQNGWPKPLPHSGITTKGI